MADFGVPVTIVASGGLPVTDVAGRGAPMVSVPSGGVAVTLVASGGLPVSIVNGNAPPASGTAALHADFLADEQGPVITAPADNATGISPTAPITLTFDEDIAFGTSGTITLRKNTASVWSDVEVFDVATEVGGGAGQVSIGGVGNTVLTINPTATMTDTTEYALRFTAGSIEDGRGNPMAAIADDTTRSFTTGSALTLLGTLTGFAVGGAAVVNVDFTSLGLQNGDLVRVFVATSTNANRTIGITTSGYTALFTPKIDTADTHRVSANLFEKVMGAVPDTSVDVTNPGSSNTAHIIIVKAYRGARTSPTTDLTPAKTQSNNSIVIDPPSNTPTTDGTIIEYWGIGARIVGTTDLYSSSDLDGFVSGKHDSAGYTGVWFYAHKIWHTGDGTIDPAALTIAATDATMSWACLSSTVSPA